MKMYILTDDENFLDKIIHFSSNYSGCENAKIAESIDKSKLMKIYCFDEESRTISLIVKKKVER